MSELVRRMEQSGQYTRKQMVDFLATVPDQAVITINYKKTYNMTKPSYVLRATWDDNEWPLKEMQ